MDHQLQDQEHRRRDRHGRDEEHRDDGGVARRVEAKLVNVTVSQKITTTGTERNRAPGGTEDAPARLTTSSLSFSASDLNQRCASVCGESARIMFSTSSTGGAFSVGWMCGPAGRLCARDFHRMPRRCESDREWVSFQDHNARDAGPT
jgi:hypothetical protein